MTAPRRPAPEHCAQCGEEIPPSARACPGCGADERTGWREQSIYDGLDLPEEEDSARPAKNRGALRWWVSLTVVALIALLLLSAVSR